MNVSDVGTFCLLSWSKSENFLKLFYREPFKRIEQLILFMHFLKLQTLPLFVSWLIFPKGRVIMRSFSIDDLLNNCHKPQMPYRHCISNIQMKILIKPWHFNKQVMWPVTSDNYSWVMTMPFIILAKVIVIQWNILIEHSVKTRVYLFK